MNKNLYISIKKTLAIIALCLISLSKSYALIGDQRPIIHQMIFLRDTYGAYNFIKQYPQIIYELDSLRNTPLHIAALVGDTELCEKIIVMNANINALNAFNETPLWYAIHSKNPETVKLFLHYHPIVTHCNAHGNNMLHLAFFNSNKKILEMLLNTHCIDVNIKNNEGYTLLHFAAMNDNVEIVKMLLDSYHADPSITNKKGQTPLKIALTKTYPLIKKAFLHAQSSSVSNNTILPLKQESINNQTDAHNPLCNGLAHYYTLIEQPILPSISEMILQEATQSVLDSITTNPQLIHYISAYGNTPLHIAAQKGNTKLCEILINLNANINALNAYGETPIWQAVRSKNLATVDLFFQHNANITYHNSKYFDILHMAVRFSTTDIVAYLLDHSNYPINTQDSKGNTLLHFAANNHNTDLIDKLIMHYKADPTIQNKLGATARILTDKYIHIEPLEPHPKITPENTNLKNNAQEVPHNESIFQAIKDAKVTLVTLLSAISPHLLISKNNENQTPLEFAQTLFVSAHNEQKKNLALIIKILQGNL